jgi:NAD(P)-dependent dehydrogenase (short-subunit alcohol dehydrogenase family)
MRETKGNTQPRRDGEPGLLDRALDWTVVPGFSSIGYALRRRSWQDPAPDALAGRSVLVTGSSSGIGAAACAGLARLGASVHMLVRDSERGEATRRRLPAALRERTRLELCDVADLDAVRAFAADFGRRVPQLHGLVHNAGVLLPRRERSPQGHELTLATHVLGPLLLTELLLPALRRAAPSQVVFVASGGAYTARLRAADPALEREEFDGPRFYAHAKRIQLVLAAELARREAGSGVAFAAAHPGWADTPGLERSLPRFHRLLRPILRDAEAGADTIVWLLANPAAAAAHPGAFWHDRRPRPAHRLPRTRESAAERERLLGELEELIEPEPHDREE